jgi:hypothetical protein
MKKRNCVIINTVADKNPPQIPTCIRQQ